MITSREHPHGYFLSQPDAKGNRYKLSFQCVDVRCHKGTPIKSWVWFFGWHWIRIWWTTQPRFTLLRSVTYVDPYGYQWDIPGEDKGVGCGYRFNGLSVPWWGWLFCTPTDPDAFAGSLVHDFVCDSRLCTPEQASTIFWGAMRANGYYRWGAFRNRYATQYLGPTLRPECDFATLVEQQKRDQPSTPFHFPRSER